MDSAHQLLWAWGVRGAALAGDGERAREFWFPPRKQQVDVWHGSWLIPFGTLQGGRKLQFSMVLAGFQALPPAIKDTNPKIKDSQNSEGSSRNLILNSHRKKQDTTNWQPEAFSPHTLSPSLILRVATCRFYPKYIQVIHSKAESMINILASRSDEASK